MTPDYRYEIKFVVKEVKLSEFRQWLWQFTTFTEMYPARVVNSMYFDDTGYQAVMENLTGIPDRSKYRLRWYSDIDNKSAVQGLRLEKKVKEGRLGYKREVILPELESAFSQMTYSDLVKILADPFAELGLYNSSGSVDMLPTLQVNYLREYWQDPNGVRVTIDNNLEFHRIVLTECISARPSTTSAEKIIEFKFPPEQKDLVADLLRTIHLVPKRNSKYLQGMAMNGNAVYL